MPTSDLLRDHPGPWARATGHPFLLGVRDGTLPPGAFDTWLVQDAHYVADLLRFQARLLARAPRAGAGGARGRRRRPGRGAGLVRGAGRAPRAGPRRAPAARDGGLRASCCERLDAADVPAALTALWAVERVYLDAWTRAAPGAPEYAEYVEHWTTPGFAAYVDGLAAAADALGGRHDDVVLAVLEAEVAFWAMALEDAA